ncbi:MAG: aminotransferase [Provencibacterium sp.]|jgi:aspartate/methionine/tyrosine aminotransferase|nr:aminotransferase [Provencibacterium sp.]
MQSLQEMGAEELASLKRQLQEEYQAQKAKGLKLDMSRGKPAPDLLDRSMALLDTVNAKSDLCAADGTDTRNYGLLDGLGEAKAFFADLLEVKPEQVIVGGNSSLNMMYDSIVRALLLGVYGGSKPWGQQGKLRFLCPVPGYDRHFAITEQLGFEMINIDMDENGPDMDTVERLTAADPSIKGIWCVPKYANPNGVVYSDETVRRFARLRPAADDFRIFWDNAYGLHDFDPHNAPPLLNIFDACREEGTLDLVYEFASTSKISFAGAGVAAMAASENNAALLCRQMSIQTIGGDKVNQLRHVRFYRDRAHVLRHMAELSGLIRPKFELVGRIFAEELEGAGIASWTKPLGGYFLSVDVLDGCAKRVVELCKEAGVTLTAAGASYPYGRDPRDRNIRIAPSYPTLEELETAAGLFCLCVKLAAAEKLLAE